MNFKKKMNMKELVLLLAFQEGASDRLVESRVALIEQQNKKEGVPLKIIITKDIFNEKKECHVMLLSSMIINLNNKNKIKEAIGESVAFTLTASETFSRESAACGAIMLRGQFPENLFYELKKIF